MLAAAIKAGHASAECLQAMTAAATRCPGCGTVLPAVDRPAHPYMTGSPACWDGYAELLAAQYASPERMSFHQLVVDAYAAQHPGGNDPRAIQSVSIHLMTMALVLEDGADPALGARLHQRMVERPVFHRLQRPAMLPTNRLTWRHVPISGPPSTAELRTHEWARSVWAEWKPYHATVRSWLERSGIRGR